MSDHDCTQESCGPESRIWCWKGCGRIGITRMAHAKAMHDHHERAFHPAPGAKFDVLKLERGNVRPTQPPGRA